MAQPFEGIKVVDISEGMAGSLAGCLLADYGADVVKVEPPGGERTRSYPGFLMWNRGKRSVVLDLAEPTDRARAVELASSADVLIENFRPGEAARVGLDGDRLRAANPGLIHCSISGFGTANAYEDLEPYEGVVAAKSGRLMDNGPMAGADTNSNGPIYISAPIGSYGAGTLAVQGIIAALLERLRTGRGQRVETSLLDGLSAATMRLAFERRGDEVIPVRRREDGASLIQRGITMSFMTAECKDGRYIQMCARQPQHFKNWMQSMGLEHLGEDPRFTSLPLGLKSEADTQELESTIRAAMLTKTRDEWMTIFVESTDVGGDPFLSPAEFLEHPQMVENGRVVELDDATHGVVRQVGPLVNLQGTPASITTSAPQLGEHQHELDQIVSAWAEAHAADRAAQAAAEPPDGAAGPRPPLQGLTILELGMFIAAPLGSTLLAEMGARVIKVEPLDGDPFRRVGLEFVHIGHGKESISIDLKSPEGKQIFDRLVRISDAMIHSYRPGVPERLGIDYESVRALNPDIVYLYAGSYGSKGPWRHRAAFHSTPHALSGGGILQAGEGNPPVDDSYPDPCAGLGAATALALGFLTRARFGIAQQMETTMICSTGWVHSNRLTHFDGQQPLPVVDHRQLGLQALFHLYPSRSGWTFIAALQQEEWVKLTSALGREDLAADERYATPAARRDNDAELIATLDAIFVTDDAHAWEKRLTSAGVSAVAVGDYSFEEFLVNEQLVASDEHHEFGTYWRLPPRVRFSESTNRIGPPAALGEHTVRLLHEVGYSDDDVARLVRDQIVVAEDSGAAQRAGDSH